MRYAQQLTAKQVINTAKSDNIRLTVEEINTEHISKSVTLLYSFLFAKIELGEIYTDNSGFFTPPKDISYSDRLLINIVNYIIYRINFYEFRIDRESGVIQIKVDDNVFCDFPVYFPAAIFNAKIDSKKEIDSKLYINEIKIHFEVFWQYVQKHIDEVIQNFKTKKSNEEFDEIYQISLRAIHDSAELKKDKFSEFVEDSLTAANNELNATADNFKKDFRKKSIEQIELHENKLKQIINETTIQVSQELKEQANSMLDSKKRELVETIILEDAMELWEGKAKQHNKYFRIGAFIFMFSVLLPVFYLLTHWGAVTEAVRALTPTSNVFPVGNLLVVTIPVIGYAWVLRLISRFTLQNMMLADDASQRSVMARTFIRLVGHGQADAKHDRAIMLNALFRPLPGAGEPDLQPPNLTDFIKGKT